MHQATADCGTVMATVLGSERYATIGALVADAAVAILPFSTHLASHTADWMRRTNIDTNLNLRLHNSRFRGALYGSYRGQHRWADRGLAERRVPGNGGSRRTVKVFHGQHYCRLRSDRGHRTYVLQV